MEKEFPLSEYAAHVALPRTRVKSAFTLAEVLITLGVIGVVAAMTIPGLITAHQKHTAVAGIMEAQSILNQAVKLYTEDTDEEGSMDFDTSLPIDEFVQKYFQPYLKVAQVCTKMEDGCWQTGDFYGYYDLVGEKMTNVPYSLVLNNGMIFGFNKVDDGDYALITVIVDINGKSKRNVLGKDVFSFYLFNNSHISSEFQTQQIKNGIYPGGYGEGGIPHAAFTRTELLATSMIRGCNPKGTTTFAYGNGRGGLGTACTALIFKDGWKISSDYPW